METDGATVMNSSWSPAHVVFCEVATWVFCLGQGRLGKIREDCLLMLVVMWL